MSKQPYIEHITEAEKEAPAYGDQQYLKAEPCGDCNRCDKCVPKDNKIGNQSSEYYKN